MTSGPSRTWISEMADFRYLLDTNILSDLLRKPDGRVVQRVALVGEATICTSIVVACELRPGGDEIPSSSVCLSP